MKRIALLFIVLSTPAAQAQVKVRGQQVYQPHEPIVLSAADVASKGASYLWDVSEPAQFREVGDSCYIWAPPGTYKVQLIAIDFETKKVERARFTFRVEGAEPPDPGPKPPPGPGPEPSDPLYLSLKAAWLKEVAADRHDARKRLAGIYAAAVSFAKNPAKGDTTVGHLLARVREAGAREVGDPLTVLPALRRTIADALNAEMGKNPAAPLDATAQQRAASMFERLAAALEALR